MKTAVSVPDDVFARADALARASGRSRSEVYSAALREYVARHAEDAVTAALDNVIAELKGNEVADVDEFARRAVTRTGRHRRRAGPVMQHDGAFGERAEGAV